MIAGRVSSKLRTTPNLPLLLVFACLLSIESIRFSAAASSSLAANILISFRSGVSIQEASVLIRDSLCLRSKLNESLTMDPFHWEHRSQLGPRLRLSLKPQAQQDTSRYLELDSWLEELKESGNVEWAERTASIQPLIAFARQLYFKKDKLGADWRVGDVKGFPRAIYNGSRETIGIIDFGLENAEKISWKPSSKRTQWKTGGAPSSLQLDHSKVRLYVEGAPILARNKSVIVDKEPNPAFPLHGTCMALLAAGPEGVAPMASLSFFDLRKLLDQNQLFFGNMDFGRDVLDWLYVGKSRILLNAWSQNPHGLKKREHDWISRDIDRFVFEKKDVLVISAVGSADPISSGALAKNGISVGMSLSGWPTYNRREEENFVKLKPGTLVSDHIVSQQGRGPTPAGRIKPEIVAPGYSIQLRMREGTSQIPVSGTSISSAMIAGFSAILREYLCTLTKWRLPSAALLKASIIAAAVPLRGYLYGIDGNIGSFDKSLREKLPNAEQGWGSPHLEVVLPQKALQTEDYFPRLKVLSSESDVDKCGDRYISEGETHEYLFCVIGGDAFSRLDAEYMNEVSVTLVWTDPMGPLDDSPYVVNNLDLQVHFEGKVLYGNGVNGGDRVNVIEKVSLPKRPSNQNATLKVVVKGVSVVERQAYALVLVGHEAYRHSCESGDAKPDEPVSITASEQPPAKSSSYMTSVILIGVAAIFAIGCLLVLRCILCSFCSCLFCKNKKKKGSRRQREQESSKEDSSSEDSSSEDSGSEESSDSETSRSESRSFTPAPARKIIDICEA